MKIIQIIPTFDLAGAEIMCENLIYALTKLGHEVVAVSLYDRKTAITERLEKKKIKIYYLGKKQGFDISIFKKIKNIFKSESPDVVHTHLYVTKYVFPVAQKSKIKVIHTIHNVAEKESGKLTRKLNDFFFKHCHVIPVALSELIKDTIIQEYDIGEDKIPVIYNGIDLSKYQIKTDYSVDGNFKILHIGRFSEQKNHVGLLKAFKIFHDNYPDSELWLIGDGEKRTEIEQYIKKNELAEAVKLLGLQSNVYGYLHDADIFTLPSNYEGMPMTLIEAMGTGLPIVATTVGGIPDMLNNESAILVPIEIEAIADAFERYYLNEKMRRVHGFSALRRADRFSSNTMAVNYLKVYNKGRPNNG